MPCTSNIAAIEAFCGANAPMLDRVLHIISLDDVTTIPAASSHVISTDITLAATKFFFAWNFSKDESSYTSTQDENGLWTTTVSIFIEKMESGKSNILNGMMGDNYLAVPADKNGNARLVGALNNGCSVTVEEVTTPKNGYNVTITWQSANSPYFYTGATPTS